jgi:hypothetical protein
MAGCSLPAKWASNLVAWITPCWGARLAQDEGAPPDATGNGKVRIASPAEVISKAARCRILLSDS